MSTASSTCTHNWQPVPLQVGLYKCAICECPGTRNLKTGEIWAHKTTSRQHADALEMLRVADELDRRLEQQDIRHLERERGEVPGCARRWVEPPEDPR